MKKKKTILILGCDGYLGYTLSVYLNLKNKYNVVGIDNLSRRYWVQEVGGHSIVPIENRDDPCSYIHGDITDFKLIKNILRIYNPDAIIHLAEQPSAPYSMLNIEKSRFTQKNNVLGTLNVLWGMKQECPKAHLVKLGCYDDKTEVLTDNGWKLFKDLEYTDKVCSLDAETEEIKYFNPENIVIYPYKGKMLKINHKSLDFLITPNHRVVYKKDKNIGLSKIKIDRADKIDGQLLRIPRSGIWKSKKSIKYFILPSYSNKWFNGIGLRKYIKQDFKIKMNDWLEFFGWWIAEGCVGYSKNKKGEKKPTRVLISQKNKANLDEIKNVIKRIGFNYYEQKYDSANVIEIQNVQLAHYLEQFGKCNKKFIPKELKFLSRKQLGILFTTMMKGDGSFKNNIPKMYYSKSYRLISDMQEIVMKLGMAATIGKQDDTYYISIAQQTNTTVNPKIKTNNRNKYEWIDYKGEVYCCTVPTGIIMVRRNGKAAWSGNTMGEYGTPNIDITEGPINIKFREREDIVPFPKQPGSFYHLSKVFDSQNIEFACKVWGLRATDINQGPVYGSRIKGMKKNQRTRFDIDHAFGTVINRFCAQAVIGYPLTVYGKGGQTRGYININDAMRAIELIINNPSRKGEFRIINQIVELFSVNEIAEMVKEEGKKIGLNVKIRHIKNPRIEKEEHYYNPDHTKLIEMGLKSNNINKKDSETLRRISKAINMKVASHNESIKKRLNCE